MRPKQKFLPHITEDRVWGILKTLNNKLYISEEGPNERYFPRKIEGMDRILQEAKMKMENV